MYGRPPQSYAAAPLDQLGISTLQVTQQRPYYFYVGFKISMNYTLLLFLDLITIQVPNSFPTCMEFQARLNTFISYVCIFFFLYICKVHIFWEGHKILRNLHQLFDWQYISRTNNWWRFRKILWPAQNIWTLRILVRTYNNFCGIVNSVREMGWTLTLQINMFMLPTYNYILVFFINITKSFLTI